MNGSLKRQILSNFAFILLFSCIFAIYCQIAIYFFNNTKVISENTAASSNLSDKLIVLDAGHGGEDGGTVGVNGIYEKVLNLQMSEAIGDYLRFAGFEVVHTRTEDIMLYDKSSDFKGKKKMLDLAARLEMAEELLPDLFISIHMNSFPDGKYSGLTVYYSPNDTRSQTIAELMRADVITHLQPGNKRELKRAGSNIYLLDRLKSPSVLVECGFLSNAAECELLSKSEYQHKLSLVLFSSVSSFFEE